MADAKPGCNWIENGEIILSCNNDYHWILPNFLIYSNGYIVSPCFTFNQEKWHLVLSQGYSASDGIIQDFNLYLWMKDYLPEKGNYRVRFSVMDSSEKERKERNIIEGETINGGFARWSFIDRKSTLTTYSYGRTQINCKIEVKDDMSSITETSSDSSGEENENIPEDNDEKQKNVSDLKGVDRLIENFTNLLNDEWGSDVILKTNDHEFHAHRIILRVRSPVFASMFQHDMMEKKTGEVDISDCTTEAFRVFLHFLYVGKADTMSSENVLDLYYIADKYQVGDLKSDCIEFIKCSLSVDNFCDVMALSLRHTESELQECATTFFCRNIKKIVKTVQWQKYITNYPIQANELIVKAIKA